MADKDKYSAQETIKVCTNKNQLGQQTNFPLNQTMQIIFYFFLSSAPNYNHFVYNKTKHI